jgi:hypothetical protein
VSDLLTVVALEDLRSRWEVAGFNGAGDSVGLEEDHACIDDAGGLIGWEQDFDCGEDVATSVGEAEAGNGMDAIVVGVDFFRSNLLMSLGTHFN